MGGRQRCVGGEGEVCGWGGVCGREGEVMWVGRGR